MVIRATALVVDTDDGPLAESWSGYALVRAGAKLKPFVVPAVADGRANLATGSGAVRLWFKPYWSSASLPNGTPRGARKPYSPTYWTPPSKSGGTSRSG